MTAQPPLSQRHPGVQDVMRFFSYGHLPEGLPKLVSERCAYLAQDLLDAVPDSPQLTLGLQLLLQAKDAFVRAALPKPELVEP